MAIRKRVIVKIRYACCARYVLRSNSILISKKIPRRRLSNLRHCCVTSLRLVSTKNRSKCCKRVMV
ncbi:Uncharacterised protein [Vibrio cholerae]|nr:Uncharacterised protein [Vibrio cholerae]